MPLELWTNQDLYQVLRDDRLDPVPSYFLDTFFTATHYSSDKEILISELPTAHRVLAPFVLPSEQGKPIFKRKGEKVKSLVPPYLKPKDAVRPEDARNVLPSEILLNGGQRPSLEQRFARRVVEVMEFQKRAIRMSEAWMAARAFIDGKITVKYDRDQGTAYPEVTIDFGRDAAHTVVLSTEYWDDPDHDIIGDLTTWSNRMYKATYGGRPSRAIIGADVVPCIQKNNGIRELLSTQIRGGEGTRVQLGMTNIDEPLSYVATIGGIGQSLEIWTYRDQVEGPDGTMVDILDTRDVLLVAPGATGVRAYGAIYDVDAMQGGDSMAIDIFPKMFKTNDPGEIYIMNQSSPLPIPLYPNRTLKARVLA